MNYPKVEDVSGDQLLQSRYELIEHADLPYQYP